MRGSADTGRTPDVRRCGAFFRSEILHQDQQPEMRLKSPPDLSHSEMRAVRAPFSDVMFGVFSPWCFSIPLLWPHLVAPIPTAKMECVMRPRGKQAKSSRQKDSILMQFF
jgi:hypothetical protein